MKRLVLVRREAKRLITSVCGCTHTSGLNRHQSAVSNKDLTSLSLLLSQIVFFHTCDEKTTSGTSCSGEKEKTSFKVTKTLKSQ